MIIRLTSLSLIQYRKVIKLCIITWGFGQMLLFSHPVYGSPFIPDIGEFATVLDAAKQSRLVSKGGEGISGLEKFASTDPLADTSLVGKVDPLGVKPTGSELPKRLTYDPHNFAGQEGLDPAKKLTEAEIKAASNEMIKSVSQHPDAFAKQMLTDDPGFVGTAVKAFQEGPYETKIAAIKKVYLSATAAGQRLADGTARDTYKALLLTQFLYWAKGPAVTEVTPELEQLRDLCDFCLQGLKSDPKINPIIKDLATAAFETEPRGPNKIFPGFGAQSVPKSNPATTNIEDEFISRLPPDKKALLNRVFQQQQADKLKQSLAEETARSKATSKASTSKVPSDPAGFNNPPTKLPSPSEAEKLRTILNNPPARLQLPKTFKPTDLLPGSSVTKPETLAATGNPLSRATKLPTPNEVNSLKVDPTRLATQGYGRSVASRPSASSLRPESTQGFMGKVISPDESALRVLRAERKPQTQAALSPDLLNNAVPLPKPRGS
ncbi:hypothetical protein DFH28DRAFT_1119134 [Melampsora americana]|nr:hypothetical protein DFH28DRAFT_1119134 [Melampsora americana]